MEREQKNLQEIINYRLDKLGKIKQAGYSPYAYNYDKTHEIQDLIEAGDKSV